MPRKRIWRRAVVCLLMVTLLPFAQLAGFAIQSAHAQSSLLNLVDYEVIENKAHFEWQLTDSNYYLTSRLYSGVQGDFVEYDVEFDPVTQHYVFDYELESGYYELYLDIKKLDDGSLAAIDWLTFTIPEQGVFSVYLFGPDEPIEGLMFYNFTTGLDLVPTAQEGEGYVRYSVETYADACFTLIDGGEGYAFSHADWLCAGSGWEHVVYANKTGYNVDVYDADIVVQDGSVSGYVWFANSGEPGYFQLNVVDGNNNIRSCGPIVPLGEVKSEFECEWYEGDVLLRIDYVLGQDEYMPTNAVFRLDNPELPVLTGFIDSHSEIGWVTPALEFAGPVDESDIALYKIVPPHDDQIPYGIQYVAADGSGSYTAAFDKFQSYVGDTYTIRMIDRQGREFASALTVPVVDNMSSAELILDYEMIGCTAAYTLSYDCGTMAPVYVVPEPADAGYTNGSIGWTLPDYGDYVPVAYDLYYADGNSISDIMRGGERVNLGTDVPETFDFELTDTPTAATHVAIVTLLAKADEVFYAAAPFFIELSESQQPQQPVMPVIVLDDFVIFGNDGRMYYHVENPDNVDYGTAYSLYRIVDGTPQHIGGITEWGDDGSVIFGNLESGTYRAVVLLNQGFEYIATFEYEFTIDSLRLNGLTVDGVNAVRDSNDPYHYTARVEWDAVEASITAMSPDGVVRIGESTVDTDVPYSVTLDDPETEVTIVVRSPEDEEQEYRLTIVKDMKPAISLSYLDVYLGTVYLWWDVAIESGNPYTTEIKLYRMDTGEEIPLGSDNSIIYQSNHYANLYNLPPAAYKVVLRLIYAEEVTDETYGRFVVNEGQPADFYFFGTDQEIDDLVIWDTDHPDGVDRTAARGDGYVRYTIDARQTCYGVKSTTWLISGPNYCANDERDFIAHVTSSDFDAHLFNSEIRSWADWVLEGTLWFYWFGNFEDYREVIDDYELVIADQDGTVHHACTIYKPDNYLEYDHGLPFTCTGVPEDARYLRIDALVGQTYVPTNAVLHIGQVGLPETIELIDADPRSGWLDLTVRFTPGDESEIALYKVIAPRHAGLGQTYTAIVEANGQETDEPYVAHFGGMETHPEDQVILQAYDRDGYLIMNHTVRPVIDVMTEQASLIEYASCYSSVPDCRPSLDYVDYPVPTDAVFEDEDPRAGARTGELGWTPQQVGVARLIAFDLYHADADKLIIRGEARANLNAYDEDFRFRLTHVPENAEYLAVVPLLADEGQYYYANELYIPLDDLVLRLEQLRVNGVDAEPDGDNPQHFTAYVDWDTEEAEIEAASSDGIVWIDEEELGPDDVYTVVLDDVESEVTIVVQSPDDRHASYVLTILKEVPDELVEDSEFVKLDDGSYGYVSRGMTAGELIAKFTFVPGTEAVVMNGDDPLDSGDTVMPGSILVLTIAARQEEIELRFLAELLRPSEAEAVTIAHVAAFVIEQLRAAEPVDLTGDGKFDREDVRLLLGELEA